MSSLSLNSVRLHTVGIESVVVNVKVFDPLAVAAVSRITVVELVIDAIATVPEIPVPLTTMPTANLLESATVKVTLLFVVVQACFMVALMTQSAPSSPESRDEMRTVPPFPSSF